MTFSKRKKSLSSGFFLSKNEKKLRSLSFLEKQAALG